MKNKIDIKREILKEKIEERNLREWKDILDKWKSENPDIHPRSSIYLKQKSFELQEKINNELEKYDNQKNQNEIAIEENMNVKILDLNEKIKLIETKRKMHDKKLKDLLYKKLSRNKDLVLEAYREAGLEIDDEGNIDDSILNNGNLPKKQKIIL